MSSLPTNEPECLLGPSSETELLIEARPRDLGGFNVRRVLPSMQRRLVGPFIFFDQMGPATFAMGTGIDVRPHPHIGLATLTYLFQGEIVHRDSLGSLQPIRPGDVNWMVAGRGIVHSERSSAETRQGGAELFGIQTWIALPLAREEDPPSFEHHPRGTIPRLSDGGAELDVVAGAAYGQSSPVNVLSPTLYVHARLSANASLPVDETHEERAFYVVEGSVQLGGHEHGVGELVVLKPGAHVTLRTTAGARVMLLGGARLDGERHIFWNFVSSSLERLEAAKRAWSLGEFPKVPGDEDEFIPLPTR